MSLGGAGGQSAGAPSEKLRAVIEQLARDPSNVKQIAARIRRDAPDLFMELVQWIQSQ